MYKYTEYINNTKQRIALFISNNINYDTLSHNCITLLYINYNFLDNRDFSTFYFLQTVYTLLILHYLFNVHTCTHVCLSGMPDHILSLSNIYIYLFVSIFFTLYNFTFNITNIIHRLIYIICITNIIYNKNCKDQVKEAREAHFLFFIYSILVFYYFTLH